MSFFDDLKIQPKQSQTFVKSDQMRLFIAYSQGTNKFDLQFNFQECELEFSTPIKFKNGSTLLSISFTHKEQSNNPSLVSSLRVIEQFDSESFLGFDLSTLESLENFRWEKHLNGFMAGYFGLELDVLSPTKKLLVLLGYQNDYLAQFPYKEDDNLQTYTERYKKKNQQRGFFFQ